MRLAAIVIGAALVAAVAAPSAAQGALDNASWRTGATFEQWYFGCCTEPGGSGVRRASEWTIPIVAVVPLGSVVTVDAYTAWMRATATLRGSPETTLRLDGLTDVKLRANVRLAGDALVATFGVNVPTGKTSLDAEELGALTVVGSPALRFATPAVGTGWGGTSGLVYTTRLGEGSWSWGFGASYEYRGRYSPAEAAALGLGSGDFDLRPGQAIRLSAGANGLVGQSAMTFSVASTVYTRDRISLSSGGPAPDPIRLGPMFTAEWHLRAAAGAFRELNVFAYDAYRMKYDRGGSSVDGTNGNELELGAQGRIPLTPSLALVTGVRGRHHTGLSVDNSLPTAAIVSGGADIGLAWRAGPVEIVPTIGGEIGRLDTGGNRLTVHKLEASFTIGSR